MPRCGVYCGTQTCGVRGDNNNGIDGASNLDRSYFEANPNYICTLYPECSYFVVRRYIAGTEPQQSVISGLGCQCGAQPRNILYVKNVGVYYNINSQWSDGYYGYGRYYDTTTIIKSSDIYKDSPIVVDVDGHIPRKVTVHGDLATAEFSDPDAGPKKPVHWEGFYIDGPNADDYTLIQPETYADIYPIPVYIYADDFRYWNSPPRQAGTYGDTVPTLTYSWQYYTDAGGYVSGTGPTGPTLPYNGDFVDGELKIGNRLKAGDILRAQADCTKTQYSSDATHPANNLSDLSDTYHYFSYCDYNITQGTIKVEALVPSNYKISFSSNTFSVETADLNVTGEIGLDKVYDATLLDPLDNSGATVSGALNGDVLTLDPSGATGRFTNRNVGSGKQVITQGYKVSGDWKSGYWVVQPVTTASITPEPVTLTAKPGSGHYGETVPTLRFDVTSGHVYGSDAITGEEAVDTLGVAGSPIDQVGTFNIVQNTLDLGTNYTITWVNNSFIAQTAKLTVVGITVIAKHQDGSATANLDTSGADVDPSDIVGSDDVTVDCSGATGQYVNSKDDYNTPNSSTGTGKTVAVTGCTLGGADASKYGLRTPYFFTGDILP